MNYFAVLALASVATAARLDSVYLPPNAGSSSGASAGLQAPFSGGFGGTQNSAGHSGGHSAGFGGTQNNAGHSSGFGGSASSNAEILRYDNEMNEEGYHYAYETSDGTKAEQEGRVLPGAVPEEGSLQVSGSYSYVGDDGQTYTITYTADENGYHAEGAHLPTPPPVPEAILKSLQLNDGVRGQYDSKKSSYDADAGY